NNSIRFLRVSKFAVLQMFSADRQEDGVGPASRVVDILAEGVDGHWTPATHLKIMKPVREVTLSIWKAMLHLRRAWLAGPSPSRIPGGGTSGGGGGDASFAAGGDRCPPWDDPAALEYWVRAWAVGGPSGPAGDTLHRLHARDVSLKARWPVQPQSPPAHKHDTGSTASPAAVAAAAAAARKKVPRTIFPGAEEYGVRMSISVDEFLSESVGEHFKFLRTAVDLDGDRLASIATFSISRTLGDTCISATAAPRGPTGEASRDDTGGGSATGVAAAATACGLRGEEGAAKHEVPSFYPPTEPSERRIVGACFHELKARAMAVAAAAAAAAGGAAAGAHDPTATSVGEDGCTNQTPRPSGGGIAEGGGGGDGAGAGDTGGGDSWSGESTAGTAVGGTPTRRSPACDDGRTASVSASSATQSSAGAGGQSGGSGDRAGDGRKSQGAMAGTTRALEPWLLPLVTRPAGFLVEVEGAVVRAGHGRALGKRLDSLVLQTKALAVALSEMPGRWHPSRGGPCHDFHRLFWKPPIPEEAFVASSARLQDRQGRDGASRAWGVHVWLRARGVGFEIADEPLEAWFEAMHPVWSRQLAARAFRRALLLRRSTAGSRHSRNGSRAAGVGEDEGADEEEVAAAAAEAAEAVEREGDEEDARSYLEHVRDTFGDHGPPPAFPLPGAATTARKKAASPRPGVWGGGGGGTWSPRLVRVRVGDVSADVTPPSGGEGLCRDLLDRLDRHPPPVGTDFGVLARIGFSVRCSNILTSLRQFDQPLFSCEGVSAGGVAMVACARVPPHSGGSLTGVKVVVIDEKEAAAGNAAAAAVTHGRQHEAASEVAGGGGRGRVAVVTRDLPPKAYLDLSVCVERPRFEYSPAHTYALADLASAAKLLLPPNLFPQVAPGSRGTGTGRDVVPPLAWWDAGRCMVHGKFDATVFGGALKRRRCRGRRGGGRSSGTVPGSGSASPGSSSLPASSGHRLSWRGGGAWRRDRRGSGSGGGSGGGVDEGDGFGSMRSTSPPFPEVVGIGGGGRRHSGPVGAGVGSGGKNSAFGVSDSGTGRAGGKGARRRRGSRGEGLDGLERGKTLMVTCVVLRVGWAGAGRVALETTGFGVEASPPPAPGLPPLFELPTLRRVRVATCTIVVAWHTLGGPSPDHWVYVRPPASSSSSSSATRLVGTSSGTAASSTTAKQQQQAPPHSPAQSQGAKTDPGPSTIGQESAVGGTAVAGGGAPWIAGGEGVEGGAQQVRATLPNRPTGATLPSLPPGTELPESLESDLSGLPPRMSASVFGCCLGWAVEWGTCFSKVPPVPVPRCKCTVPTSLGRPSSGTQTGAAGTGTGGNGTARKRSSSSDATLFSRLRREAEGSSPAVVVSGDGGGADGRRGSGSSGSGGSGGQSPAVVVLPPCESFADLVRGFRLGPVFLAEMDASAYNTAPADPHKRGVRLSIRGGVAASLCFSVEKSGAINPFTTGRVVIPTTSLVVTTVHGLRLRAGKIEAR
ncbi:unnamed protein product, partial [Ectocarpus fasciculatus]